VSQETGVPLELLGRVLESMGFVPMAPHESIREDELEIVPLLQLGIDLLPLVDPALLAIYHRQEELLWTEGAGRAHRERTRTGRRARAARAGPRSASLDSSPRLMDCSPARRTFA
jgi:hypothetical protein